jgi:hypothetical protein
MKLGGWGAQGVNVQSVDEAYLRGLIGGGLGAALGYLLVWLATEPEGERPGKGASSAVEIKEPAARKPRADAWLETLRSASWPIGGLAAAVLLYWAFAPGAHDRWVKRDGAVACQDAADIEDVQSESASLRRFTIEDLVTESMCVVLLADERVQLVKLGKGGGTARIVLGRDGRAMWVALSDLTHHAPNWLTMPWHAKEDNSSSPRLTLRHSSPPSMESATMVTDSNRRTATTASNPFDQFDELSEPTGASGAPSVDFSINYTSPALIGEGANTSEEGDEPSPLSD